MLVLQPQQGRHLHLVPAQVLQLPQVLQKLHLQLGGSASVLRQFHRDRGLLLLLPLSLEGVGCSLLHGVARLLGVGLEGDPGGQKSGSSACSVSLRAWNLVPLEMCSPQVLHRSRK